MSAMLLWGYRGGEGVCRGGRASESGEAGKSRGPRRERSCGHRGDGGQRQRWGQRQQWRQARAVQLQLRAQGGDGAEAGGCGGGECSGRGRWTK